MAYRADGAGNEGERVSCAGAIYPLRALRPKPGAPFARGIGTAAAGLASQMQGGGRPWVKKSERGSLCVDAGCGTATPTASVPQHLRHRLHTRTRLRWWRTLSLPCPVYRLANHHHSLMTWTTACYAL